MKPLLRLLTLLLFPVLTFAEPTTHGAPILVLGDSLSASYGIDRERGWVSLLAQRLEHRGLSRRIVNASVSGETTSGGVTRLGGLLEEHRPGLLVIELGANDGLRGTPLGVIRENLTTLVRRGQEAGSTIVLLGVRLPPNYGAAYTEGFQEIYREVARAEGVALVPDMLAGVAEDRSLMQADDLHPNAEAQPRILENIWPVLEPLIADH
jgi:acyl-CoA thioesterase-1